MQVNAVRQRADFRRPESRVVGIHHFSGSWLGNDGSKSLGLMNEATQGKLTAVNAGVCIIRASCMRLRSSG